MRLDGKTVLLTRPRRQSARLIEALETLGAQVLEFPTIEIVPPDDWTAVDRAIARLSTYDWIAFTSANAVEYFLNRMRTGSNDPLPFPGVTRREAPDGGLQPRMNVAAVGHATAARLSDYGVQVTIQAPDSTAESLAGAFPRDLQNKRILFPRAEAGRDVLRDTLRQRGADVDVVTVYRTIRPAGDPSAVRTRVLNGSIDAVLFASPSAARNFVEMFQAPVEQLFAKARAIAIGPVTAESLRSLGIPVQTVAASPAPADVAEALIESLG